MLTFYHAPMSRSSRIVSLMDEMAVKDRVEIKPINITRQDGSGERDLGNPHPEGKAPALQHDGTLITESGAVILYLTTLFPDSGMAPKVGDATYGSYLTWLFWYGGVVEPVIVCEALGLIHPGLNRTFRSHTEVIARIRSALEQGPYLLGENFSAADVLVHSPYAWFKNLLPEDPLIRDWVARCQARPSVARTSAFDAGLLAQTAA